MNNLDRITDKLTCETTFKSWIDGIKGTYRPTIHEESPDHIALADAFDAVMLARGIDKVAFRGSSKREEPETLPEGTRVTWTTGSRDGSIPRGQRTGTIKRALTRGRRSYYIKPDDSDKCILVRSTCLSILEEDYECDEEGNPYSALSSDEGRESFGLE